MVGQAFNFNGTGAQVRIASRPNLRPTNALTLEGWVKPTVVTGDQGILVKWDSAPGNQKTFSFSLAGDGRCYLLLSGSGSGEA